MKRFSRKCPACKKKLKIINPAQVGEYICDNDNCPANIEMRGQHGCLSGCVEFYGTQEEINKQWH